MKTLAERLRWAREKRGWTQARLAKEAGLKSQSMIGNLESGARLRSSHLPKIAQALNVNALWLAEGQLVPDATDYPSGDPDDPSNSDDRSFGPRDGLLGSIGRRDGPPWTPEKPTQPSDLTPREIVLLDLFKGLTSSQQDDVVRRLQDTKQQNDALIEELVKAKRA